MKELAKASIFILVALFLFVGCREDGGGGGATQAAPDTSSQVNLSIESFSLEISSVPNESTAVNTPEPMTLLLFGCGLLGLWVARRKFTE